MNVKSCLHLRHEMIFVNAYIQFQDTPIFFLINSYSLDIWFVVYVCQKYLVFCQQRFPQSNFNPVFI